jgi:thiamine-phosphate pyrophosphorylase
MKKDLPKGLYALTAENMSRGRNNIEVIKAFIDGGVKIIQYRDKEKTKLEKFKQCESIRKLTEYADICLIVNDDIDIALAINADGIHLGQDDLPIAEARKIVGDMLIGLSTHCPAQAQKAVSDGADYIGVGPIYKTATKIHAQPVGFSYLEYCMENIKIPKVAIGGIKLSNLADIAAFKPENICMVSELTDAQDIVQTVKAAKEIMDDKN